MTIDLDVGSEPISGALDDGAGSVIEFAGWLELMSALETASEHSSPSAND